MDSVSISAVLESVLSLDFGAATGVARQVDVVAGDEDWFIAEAERAQVRITHIIDTHVHADHYSGGRELARRAQSMQGFMNALSDIAGGRAVPLSLD